MGNYNELARLDQGGGKNWQKLIAVLKMLKAVHGLEVLKNFVLKNST